MATSAKQRNHRVKRSFFVVIELHSKRETIINSK